MKKVLTAGGAVFTVSRDALEAMSADTEVASVSSDALVRGQMAVETETTGAEAAWAGLIDHLGAVSGRGIGVAVIDSSIANHPGIAGRVVASVDFTARRGRGLDEYGHGTHVAGIIGAASARDSVYGMAPGAHLINLKVLAPTAPARRVTLSRPSTGPLPTAAALPFAC